MADYVTALVHFPSSPVPPFPSSPVPPLALLSALGALRLRAPTIHACYGETSP